MKRARNIWRMKQFFEVYKDFPKLSALRTELSWTHHRLITANKALITLYWDIGKSISEKQESEGWGAKVIDRLSHDLKKSFPDMSGFSPRNLKYMRTFFQAWPDRSIVQRTVAQIPWRSNLTLLEKLKKPEQRLWYAEKQLKTDGVKMSSPFKLKPVCIRELDKVPITLKPACPQQIPI